jgi:hypothetical protein
MKSIAMISRAGVYEAIALAVFAGRVVVFVRAAQRGLTTYARQSAAHCLAIRGRSR